MKRYDFKAHENGGMHPLMCALDGHLARSGEEKKFPSGIRSEKVDSYYIPNPKERPYNSGLQRHQTSIYNIIIDDREHATIYIRRPEFEREGELRIYGENIDFVKERLEEIAKIELIEEKQKIGASV